MEWDLESEEIFLSILNRLPTAKEVELGLKAIKDGEADHASQVAEFLPKKKAFDDYQAALDARQAAWEASLANAPTWEAMPASKASSVGKAKFNINAKDHSVLVNGPNPLKDTYTVTFTTKLKNVTALRLEVLSDPALPGKGPGRADNGNFVLQAFTVNAAASDKLTSMKPVALHKAVATLSQPTFDVGNAIDNNPTSGWAIANGIGNTQSALFEVKEAIKNESGTTFTVTFSMQFGQKHTIGKFRLSATNDVQPKLADGVPANLRALLAVPAAQRTDAQKTELLNTHRSRDAEYLRLAGTVVLPPPADKRVTGAQDLAWALINTEGFLFNH